MTTLIASLLFALLHLHGASAQGFGSPQGAPTPGPEMAYSPEFSPQGSGIAPSPSNDTEADVPLSVPAPVPPPQEVNAPSPAPSQGLDGRAPAPAPFRGLDGRAPAPAPSPFRAAPIPAHGPRATTMPRRTPPLPPKASIASVGSRTPTSPSVVKPKSPPPHKPDVVVSSTPSTPIVSPPSDFPPTTFDLRRQEGMDACCLWKRSCNHNQAVCSRETLRECANGVPGGLCGPCQLCRDQRFLIPTKNLIIQEDPLTEPPQHAIDACFRGQGDTVYNICSKVVYQCHVYTDYEGRCPPYLNQLLEVYEED